ncbi:MAG: glutamyl-tRNA reductase [Thermodesulforhabdaceae bacterium]|jgi:glutamyl-tRNA reductase
MEDHILIIGMNHKTAPVEVREKVAYKLAQDDFSKRAGLFLDNGLFKELMLISTCNRVELIAVCKNPDNATGFLKCFLADGEDQPLSDEYLYIYKDLDAVVHIFSVASGLDSMIMGEPQILGQIKEAYRQATLNKTVGVILNRLMHKTFSVAKRVRSETGIGCRAVSVSYAAVELAKKIFGTLQGKKVLLIGAGEMAELAAEHFIKNGASHLIIANRTMERALDLARRFRAATVPFAQILDALEAVDVVLSSTGSPDPIIRKDEIRSCMKKRKHKPLFLIDIAVPRDIDPSVNDLDNVYLYDIDDLQDVVEWNREERKKEAVKAQHIIEEETVKFHRWLQTLDVVPTIIALRRKAEQIRAAELEKTLSQLPHLSDYERKAIFKLTEAILKKILHDPIMFVKRKATRPSRQFYVDLVQQVFALPMRNDDVDLAGGDLPDTETDGMEQTESVTSQVSEIYRNSSRGN